MGTYCLTIGSLFLVYLAVISGQPHKFSGTVAELLGRGDHVDALIQELAHFFLGESVLDHGDHDLDSHCSLLSVFRSR